MLRFFLVWFLSAPLFAAPQDDADDLRRAIAMHQAGDFNKAIEGYQIYLKAHPEASGVRSNLGAALAHEGRIEEAIREYGLALDSEPGNSKARLNLALAEYKIGRIRKAALNLETVHTAEPENEQVTLLLAECDLRIGGYKKTIALLDGPGMSAGNELAVAYLLGTALIRDNQIDRGQFYINRILKNGESAEARLLLGTAKMMGNDYKGAREDLARSIQLNPKLPEAHSYLGLTLLRTGDIGGAEGAFRGELANDPQNFDANLQLGGLLRQDQRYADSRPLLRRALAMRPDDFGVRYQLAAMDLEEDHAAEAQMELEKLTKEAPTFVQAHVTLATAYYRLQRKEDGDRERETIRKLNAATQAKQPGVAPAEPANK